MFILNLIVFILVLGVIILIHELGHFFFAKRAKILCHEFAIGMGPAIWQKRKGETMYSIRSIPIGGFVSMAGEAVSDALIKKEQVIGVNLNSKGQVKEINLTEDVSSELVGIVKDYDLYGKDFKALFIVLEINGVIQTLSVLRDAKYVLSPKREMWITPSEKSFESKTLWQRFLVIFAGPMMNFILAFFIFLIVGLFLVKPNTNSSKLGAVGTNSAAEILGLKEGDIITSLNDQTVSSWHDISMIMANLNHVNLNVSYERDGVMYQPSENMVLSVIIQMANITNFTQDGQRYSDQPIIGQAAGRASQNNGLTTGDIVKSIIIDGQTYTINHWDNIIEVFKDHTHGSVTFVYERQGETKETTFELLSERALTKLGYQAIIFQMGVSPTSSYNLGYSLLYPFQAVSSNVLQVLNTLGLLFDRQENLGVGDLSGPVGIFNLVSQTTRQGFLSILGFTAFLSINIGLLNLLPIPALDGGRLVFLGVEAITKKPLNRKLENTINNVMFFLLIGLFIFVTYNDIIRLIQG